MKAYKVGDCWEKEKAGVTYLMQKQPTGRAKAIKRLTPYVYPNRANKRTNQALLPKQTEKPVNRKKTKPIDNWIRDIKPNSGVKGTKPFDPNTHKMVKIDSRTWKMIAI